MDIYIKPVKKAIMADANQVTVQDVAEVIATADVAKKVQQMKLMDIKIDGKKANFLISVTDIIKVIKKTYPEYTVNNVGAQDTIVQYATQKSKDVAWWKWAKVAFVSLVLLAGSSTAIMSFHADGQIVQIFENYYRVFFGEEIKNPLLISIPYSIGLGVGVLVFFNHFMGKKVTDDPTPIEVELAKYDIEVNDTIVDVLSQEGGQNGLP